MLIQYARIAGAGGGCGGEERKCEDGSCFHAGVGWVVMDALARWRAKRAAA
jgi:hypothetical protein